MKNLSCILLLPMVIVAFGCSKLDVKEKGEMSAIRDMEMQNISMLLAGDPFGPWLTSIPAVVQTISTTNSGSGASAITTKRFTLSSKGGVNTVFAIMAYPQAAGVYPAILFNHGGSGNAETQLGNVNSFAARGYVTLAVDLPSIAGTSNTPNSSGPWKSDTGGDAPKFNVSGGVENCRLTDAGIAGLQAFNYLRAQANVNPNNVGISGSSWGGYMTTLLSGLLGNRVKAAYSYYGCGFYELGTQYSSNVNNLSAADKNTWLTYFDAGRRCSTITAPYFIEEPSNDTFFWPEAVAATLNAIPGTRNLVIIPNANHSGLPAGQKEIYMDYYLKGAGKAYGNISMASSLLQTDGSLQVNMNVSVPSGISVSSVKLYYSVPTATWQTRNWIAINASLVSGMTYRASLPSGLVSQQVNYYGQLSDSRSVLTSSAMLKAGTSAGVVFYQNTNYTGAASQSLGVSSYTQTQLAALGVPNDWASSVKVPAGRTLIMYSNYDLTGTSWTRTGDTPDFVSLSPSANDAVSSCRIQ